MVATIEGYSMTHRKSAELFAKASHFIPGGVNSPVRAYRSVSMTPPFIKNASGATITDVDGNTYIDYVGSWGPMILGHAHPEVTEAIRESLLFGTSFGAPTKAEIDLAELIVKAVPSVDLVRMVNSGTEAVMSAIRLARGYTGRDKILKFNGCYHGHSDALLAKAGSGIMTYGVPGSPGVSCGTAKDTLTMEYNDIDMVEEIFRKEGDLIAAVIFEPVAGNMGVIPPSKGFINKLREITKNYGAILIADEVITGFRLNYGGAQVLYGFEADLTCFGKIIGGGLPVGAYGGKKHIMEYISPVGPVYQAGTLSGNPLAMAAGCCTLRILKDNPIIYHELEEKSSMLERELLKLVKQLGVTASINRTGSMLCVFFVDHAVTNYNDAIRSDTALFSAYFAKMLEQGIYLAPSQFEAAFISAAHTTEDIHRTLEAAQVSLKKVLS